MDYIIKFTEEIDQFDRLVITASLMRDGQEVTTSIKHLQSGTAINPVKQQMATTLLANALYIPEHNLDIVFITEDFDSGCQLGIGAKLVKNGKPISRIAERFAKRESVKKGKYYYFDDDFNISEEVEEQTRQRLKQKLLNQIH